MLAEISLSYASKYIIKYIAQQYVDFYFIGAENGKTTNQTLRTS